MITGKEPHPEANNTIQTFNAAKNGNPGRKEYMTEGVYKALNLEGLTIDDIDRLWNLLESCWNMDPSARLKITAISNIIEGMCVDCRDQELVEALKSDC